MLPAEEPGGAEWYGLERGASLAGLAATTTSNGVTNGSAFPVAVSWLGAWLQKNPSWDWRALTYAHFDSLFQQSVTEFSDAIATDNPGLSAFKKDGGKLLFWHGLADQLIFPQGTISYYQRVQQVIGGPVATDSFARLFLASGAQHHASAVGPAPAQPLDAGRELGRARHCASRPPRHHNRSCHRRGDRLPADLHVPAVRPLHRARQHDKREQLYLRAVAVRLCFLCRIRWARLAIDRALR